MDTSFLEDGNGEFDFRKISAIIASVAIILVIAIFLLEPQIKQLDANKWDDVANFYQQYLHLKNGEIPYKDFVFEYPPLAIIIIGIPGVLSFSEDSYGIMFTIFSTIAAILCYYFLMKIGKNLGLKNRIISIMMILCTLLLTRCFFRLELFLMLFVILGFYFYSEKRYELAFVMMSLGVMLKLVPVLFAIPMLIPFLLRKDYFELVKNVGICVVVCAAITLPFLIADSSSAFDYLTYHSDRMLQLESVAASFVLLINIFVPIVDSCVYEHGSQSILGSVPDAIASGIMYVMAIAVVIFVLFCVLRYREELKNENNALIIAMGIVSIMLFVALNKVFSSQYLIWVLPLIALLVVDHRSNNTERTILHLSVICLALTILETYPLYPMLYQELNPIAVLVLLARNLVFCGIIFYIARLIAERYQRTTCLAE